MTDPLVVSVVLNWRKAEMTSVCVEHLLASAHPRHEIVVVDNGSSDGSVETLRARFPKLTVIGSTENLGFSRGCNLGVRRALDLGADYVALVNNDLRMGKHSVSAASAALQANPGYGAVTGKIFSDAPGVLWQAGGHIDERRVMGVPHGFFEPDTGRHDTPGTTGWASGAMSTFRATALIAIGLLPEEYFFGQEEWDFSTALLRAGWQIGYAPAYVGTHAHGSSYAPHAALNSYGQMRNRNLYAEKYLSPWAYRAWRLASFAYLQMVMRRKLESAGSHDDPALHVRAMLLGHRRHRRGLPVTLGELQAICHTLDISSAWEPESTDRKSGEGRLRE